MIKRRVFLSCFYLLTYLFSYGQVQQKSIVRVDKMPDLPKPLQIIDWKDMALQFDKLVYDFDAKGKYWPLVWIDSTAKNFDQPTLGMYTAIGDVRQGLKNHNGMFHEAMANMGAVLGASLMGIDKSNQENRNYVGMLKNYFNKGTGWNIMMNNTAPEVALLGGGYGRDWWYDVYPNLLFYAIYDKYPAEPGFDDLAKSVAEKFYAADSILNGNYDYSYFDYGRMTPMKNNICAQPDAAAGHAWVLYAAYRKFGDKRYLMGALSSMKALQANRINPTYELLMPFGAYMAAVLNAEQGTSFDLRKMLDWTFDGTAVCREGWGVLTGNWNGYDVSGTVGSTVDHGGYGFLMNTFDAAWPLLPLVRYEPAYANAIGKWMLNAVNASRLFYPRYIPREHQTLPDSADVTKGVIAYEGIAAASTFDTLYQDLKAPVAQGDGPKWVPGKNPQVSQFSVYGSAHVGMFGATVEQTDVEGILKLDLLATDFFREDAYPTYLCYNPYPMKKTIRFNIKETGVLYDLVSQKIVSGRSMKVHRVDIPAKQSVVLVCIPTAFKPVFRDNKMFVGDVIVDFKRRKN